MNALLHNADTFFTVEVVDLNEEMKVTNTVHRGETVQPDQITEKISLVYSEEANI